MTLRLVNELQQEFGLSEAQVLRLITRSPHTYKIYPIPKKNGGTRIIAQPAKETKAVQNWLIDNVFGTLPIHTSATAYKKGASIKANATAHVNSIFLSKFDFKDFFSSIKASDIRQHLIGHLSKTYTPEDIELIVRLTCIMHRGASELCLSIGAPSSPLLSNSIMHEFDEEINTWCQTRNIIYTRYADDLTFSSNTPKTASFIDTEINIKLKQIKFPRLQINLKKTIHLSKKNQRRVTGIVINNSGELSLGREKKKLISALIHKFKTGKLDSEQHPKLQGLLGFALDIEPLFFNRMKEKYSANVIDTIMRIRKQAREF